MTATKNYIKKVVFSADKKTRLIAASNGVFYSIEQTENSEYPYRTVKYTGSSNPFGQVAKTLKMAYGFIKNDNPGCCNAYGEFINK